LSRLDTPREGKRQIPLSLMKKKNSAHKQPEITRRDMMERVRQRKRVEEMKTLEKKKLEHYFQPDADKNTGRQERGRKREGENGVGAGDTTENPPPHVTWKRRASLIKD